MNDMGPNEQTPSAWEQVGRPFAPAPAPRGKMLLVDDNLALLALLETGLSRAGFAVVTAHDGIDALSSMYARRPDAVLVDLAMPRMNGLELIIQVRTERRFRDVTVLAMSGHEGLLRRALEVGACASIAKPLSIDRIVAAHVWQQRRFAGTKA